MKVSVWGSDGFCGWPTTLHLSALGHEVAIVDNLSRREIDIELECESLTPLRPMGERLRAWGEVSGRDIAFHSFNVAKKNYQRLLDLLKEWQPQAIVHFAEQRVPPKPVMTWKTRITTEPGVLAGEPIVKGTRLAADFILSLFAEGWTEGQVLENYPQLDREDLKAVFAFVQACMAEEDCVVLEKLG